MIDLREGGGTEVVVMQERFASGESRTEHVKGWELSLCRLAGFLA